MTETRTPTITALAIIILYVVVLRHLDTHLTQLDFFWGYRRHDSNLCIAS